MYDCESKDVHAFAVRLPPYLAASGTERLYLPKMVISLAGSAEGYAGVEPSQN